MDKKKNVKNVSFKADYLRISGIEWVDEEDECGVAGFPTEMTFDDEVIIELPENFFDLEEDEESEVLRAWITRYLKSTFGMYPVDFEFKAFGFERMENTESEDDEDLDDIKPYQPVCHLEALLGLDSIVDNNGNEFVLLPKAALLEVINSRKFNQ